MGGNDFADRFKDDIKGKIICEVKGDSKYIAIGAASILAKVERDKIINMISKHAKQKDPELPPMGSGYPNDEYTINLNTLPEGLENVIIDNPKFLPIIVDGYQREH